MTLQILLVAAFGIMQPARFLRLTDARLTAIRPTTAAVASSTPAPSTRSAATRPLATTSLQMPVEAEYKTLHQEDLLLRHQGSFTLATEQQLATTRPETVTGVDCSTQATLP